MANAGYNALVHQTAKGTPYLREPGVVLLARTMAMPFQLEEFLSGFDPELEFNKYLSDPFVTDGGDENVEALTKIAGQLCYMSFGPERTWNEDMSKYIDNILKSGHGSVLEHASFSFLYYGIDRSVTHELVRHRAGVAFSQVSQRYVDGKVLRFVERKSYQDDVSLHALFEQRIDRAVHEYNELAARLMVKLEEQPFYQTLSKRDRRKIVNQDARSCLPNETEAPIVATGNVRAWRHMSQMRGSSPADVAIRALLNRTIPVLKAWGGSLFADFEQITLNDGSQAWTSKYAKV